MEEYRILTESGQLFTAFEAPDVVTALRLACKQLAEYAGERQELSYSANVYSCSHSAEHLDLVGRVSITIEFKEKG